MIGASVTQVTGHVLMVRPRAFAANAETAASNAFQRSAPAPAAALQVLATQEFDAVCAALRGAGIAVEVFDDTTEPAKPDAVFPNNWLSSHDDGTLVVYPLASRNRRAERRADILEHLYRHFGFRRERLLDLTDLERQGQFLEGTGSLVLDRRERVAYACVSPRTSVAALDEFARRTGFEVTAFHACDAAGVPLYHTNVMMSLGESFALACFESIGDAAERARVRSRLLAHHDRLLEISHTQMQEFAGNLLQLAAPGGTVVVMSTRARQALTVEQVSLLGERSRLLAVPIPTIETVGGGSLRCMLAELFPPRMSA